MSSEDRQRLEEARRIGDTDGFAAAVHFLFGKLPSKRRRKPA